LEQQMTERRVHRRTTQADSTNPASLDVRRIQAELRRFADERDWNQFHSPKNLAMALTAESGELLEIFQWLTPDQSAALSREDRVRVEQEIADILIYLLRLADQLDVQLPQAIERKIAVNAERYPAGLSKGHATRPTRTHP
jgi:dCTP diphosphatase